MRHASVGQQGIERKVVQDVTEGSVNLTMVWTVMVTDDSILAASACKRKWINRVAQRYMSSAEFCHGLRNGYHLDGEGILTVLLSNGPACSSQLSAATWLEMDRNMIHAVMKSNMSKVSTLLGQVLLPTSFSSNMHTGASGPSALPAVVGYVELVILGVEPSDVEKNGTMLKDCVMTSAAYGGRPVVKVCLGVDLNRLLILLSVEVGSKNNTRAVTGTPALAFAASKRIIHVDANGAQSHAEDVMQPLLFHPDCGIIDRPEFGPCYCAADPRFDGSVDDAIAFFHGTIERLKRKALSSGPNCVMRGKTSRIVDCVKLAVAMTNFETISKGMGFEEFRVRPPPPVALPPHVPVRLLPAPPYPADYLSDVRLDLCPAWIDKPRPMRLRDDRDPQLDPFPQPVID